MKMPLTQIQSLSTDNDIKSIKLSPTDNTIASGTTDGTIIISDIISGNCITELKGHKNRVIQLVYSRTGDYLASCDSHRRLRVWDTSTWECIMSVRAYSSRSRMMYIDFLSDGITLATVGRDIDEENESYLNKLKLWHIEKSLCKKEHLLRSYFSTILSLFVIDDNNFGILYDKSIIDILNIKDNSTRTTKIGFSISDFSFSKEKKQYSVVGKNKDDDKCIIQTINSLTGDIINEFKTKNDTPTELVNNELTFFSPSGNLLMTVYRSSIEIRETEGMSTIFHIPENTYNLFDLSNNDIFAFHKKWESIEIKQLNNNKNNTTKEEIIYNLKSKQASSPLIKEREDNQSISQFIYNTAVYIGQIDGKFSDIEKEIFYDYYNNDKTLNYYIRKTKTINKAFPPSKNDLNEVIGIIKRRFDQETVIKFKKTVLDLATEIAKAEGGILGFGNKINKEERTGLHILEEMLEEAN